MGDEVEPYRIAVPDAVLADLAGRLARTRLPDQLPGTGWEWGTPAPWLADLVDHWRLGYDWRTEEAGLNRFPQVRTEIDGGGVHALHVRSPHPGALPVMLIHGWPGSVVEFLDVVPRLVDPPAFGGDAADALHVVVPSLPGHGFSGPTRAPGWDVARIAAAFVVLMDRMGYGRFGVQGGDWGAQIGTRLALLAPDRVVGLHLNMPLASPPASPGDLTDEERADLAAMTRFQREHAAYAAVHMAAPQTLGAALADSPVGLLAWIGERFATWSDHDGDPLCVFSRDRLLTNVMTYWVTGTITSSLRLYRETAVGGALREPLPFVDVPTGVARYPAENVLRFPRSWVERQYRITRWSTPDVGGHFAAMEQPATFADDVLAFFRTVR